MANAFIQQLTASSRFVCVGDSGTIFNSSDGLAWTNCSITSTGNLHCVAYGAGLFAAAGTVGAVSTDGVVWSPTPTNPPFKFKSMIYANGMFVAGAAAGLSYSANTMAILTSTNGIDWQLRYSQLGYVSDDIENYVPVLAYQAGKFIAFIATAISKSPDGINWSSGVYLPWYDSDWWAYYPKLPPVLCGYKGRFLLGGVDGIIMSSGEVPIVLSSPRVTASGFSFDFNSQLGAPYRVQSSTNLSFWEDLYGDVANLQPTTFTDPQVTNRPYRFFRVVSP